jgi:uncharacterized phage protein (TIGR02218 family)
VAPVTKAITGALNSHFAQDSTTLATLWLVERLDGAVYAFTDHDQDIPYGGLTYKAATGYSASDIRSNSALAVDNLDITGFVDSSAITEADLLAGKWDYATVTISTVNYEDLSQGELVQRTGKIGEISVRGGIFVAELRGLMQQLQQEVGEVFSAACRNTLGDAACTVNLATYTVAGTVTGAADRRTFTDSGRAEAAGYFNFGKLTWTGGANDGVEMEVKAFASGVFTLAQSMPYAITVGDTYSVYPGCAKDVPDCRDKFGGNVVNFNGEWYVPGIDALFRGPR